MRGEIQGTAREKAANFISKEANGGDPLLRRTVKLVHELPDLRKPEHK